MVEGPAIYCSVRTYREFFVSNLSATQRLGGICYERITVVLCGLATKGVILPPCPLRYLKSTDLVEANNCPHYILCGVKEQHEEVMGTGHLMIGEQ